MIYETETIRLKVIREVFSSPDNDIVVCAEEGNHSLRYHTLWVVHEHQTAKKLLETFHSHMEIQKEEQEKLPLFCFTYGADICFSMPYREERPLGRFFPAGTDEKVQKELVYESLLLECMATPLPPSILFLVLLQEQISVTKEGTVYFHYNLHLKDFDSGKKERDCVKLCAGILLQLMESQGEQQAFSYQLIRRKLGKNSYTLYTQLYKDLKVTKSQGKKHFLRELAVGKLEVRKDSIFRALFLVCIVSLMILAVMLVSQILYGEIPVFRIFTDSFRQIGTESLLQ